jgi:hypothetical protein
LKLDKVKLGLKSLALNRENWQEIKMYAVGSYKVVIMAIDNEVDM